MLLPALLLLLAGEPSPAPRVDYSRPVMLYAASLGADYGTTRYNLAHGFAEANPVARALTPEGKAALGLAAFVLADAELQRHNRRGLLKVLRIGGAVVGFGPALVNVWAARTKHPRIARR